MQCSLSTRYGAASGIQASARWPGSKTFRIVSPGASMANTRPMRSAGNWHIPGRQTIALGGGGFHDARVGIYLTQVERKIARSFKSILNNEMLDFVHIEQQEAGSGSIRHKLQESQFCSGRGRQWAPMAFAGRSQVT